MSVAPSLGPPFNSLKQNTHSRLEPFEPRGGCPSLGLEPTPSSVLNALSLGILTFQKKQNKPLQYMSSFFSVIPPSPPSPKSGDGGENAPLNPPPPPNPRTLPHGPCRRSGPRGPAPPARGRPRCAPRSAETPAPGRRRSSRPSRPKQRPPPAKQIWPLLFFEVPGDPRLLELLEGKPKGKHRHIFLGIPPHISPQLEGGRSKQAAKRAFLCGCQDTSVSCAETAGKLKTTRRYPEQSTWLRSHPISSLPTWKPRKTNI